jgi:hypothetical protein
MVFCSILFKEIPNEFFNMTISLSEYGLPSSNVIVLIGSHPSHLLGTEVSYIPKSVGSKII